MELTHIQKDTLTELVNIGIGKAASILNQMVAHPIHLTVPDVRILLPQDIKHVVGTLTETRLASVQLGFRGEFSGKALLLFPRESASNLVTLLTGEMPGVSDLDTLRIGTLTEVGNIMVNGVMGVIANAIRRKITYTLPRFSEDYLENLLADSNLVAGASVILAQTHFSIEQLLIEGDIIITFEMGSFDSLMAAIDTLIEELN